MSNTRCLLAGLLLRPVLAFIVVISGVSASGIDDYTDDPEFRPVVTAFHKKDKTESFEALNRLLQTRPNNADAFRLGMLVATGFDQYDELFQFSDSLLRVHPQDKQGLGLTLLYSRALEKYDLYVSTLVSLEMQAPDLSRAMVSIIDDVEEQWSSRGRIEHLLKETAAHLGILALGSPANDDGTPKPRLKNTLKKTLELASTYPAAPIFVSGGAVYSQFTEAVAMKNWLIRKGVDGHRIVVEDLARDTVGNAKNIMPHLSERKVSHLLLVTVDYHLPRSTLIFDGVFQKHGLDVKLIGVAADSDLKGPPLLQRLKLEKIASYRDRSRALGLYSHQEFENLNVIPEL
jgi:vancomycin permeability regulator SanA